MARGDCFRPETYSSPSPIVAALNCWRNARGGVPPLADGLPKPRRRSNSSRTPSVIGRFVWRNVGRRADGDTCRPPWQVGKGDRHDDLLGQNSLRIACELGRVFGNVGLEAQGARGRVLLGAFFFAPLSVRRAWALDDKALGAMPIPQNRSHGVKLMVWDRHVPPRPFSEHTVTVAVMLCPAGL
jgi:hypothetical protein